MARLQLFEFNDLAFVPAAVRDTVVESLGNTLAWGRILDGLVEPLEACLRAAGTHEILDIGSGSGRPAALLIDAFRRRGATPPHFRLTDLHPRPHVWEGLRSEALDFVADPVDATSIPASEADGRVRAIVNVLHHLPPPLAQAVLLDACRHGRGVFVAECFGRNPLGFLTMWPTGLPALLANPALTSRDRLTKIGLTWLTPAAAAIGLWDGLVSTMRIHTPDELRAMVAPAGEGWTWQSGTFTYLAGGRGYWFWGVPRGTPAAR